MLSLPLLFSGCCVVSGQQPEPVLAASSGQNSSTCCCSGARTGSGRLVLPKLAALVYQNSGQHSPLLGVRVGDRLVGVIQTSVSLDGV